jgi:hypothetical protein
LEQHQGGELFPQETAFWMLIPPVSRINTLGAIGQSKMHKRQNRGCTRVLRDSIEHSTVPVPVQHLLLSCPSGNSIIMNKTNMTARL